MFRGFQRFLNAIIFAGMGVLLPRINIKDNLSSYSYSHNIDEVVMGPSYHYNVNPSTGKTTSLYWDGQGNFWSARI